MDLQPWMPGLEGKAAVFGSRSEPLVASWATDDQGNPHHSQVMGAEGIGNFIACYIDRDGGVGILYGDPSAADAVVEKTQGTHLKPDVGNEDWNFAHVGSEATETPSQPISGVTLSDLALKVAQGLRMADSASPDDEIANLQPWSLGQHGKAIMGLPDAQIHTWVPTRYPGRDKGYHNIVDGWPSHWEMAGHHLGDSYGNYASFVISPEGLVRNLDETATGFPEKNYAAVVANHIGGKADAQHDYWRFAAQRNPFSYGLGNWEPGHHGKGMQLHDGREFLWKTNTYDGYPTHPMLLSALNDDEGLKWDGVKSMVEMGADGSMRPANNSGWSDQWAQELANEFGGHVKDHPQFSGEWDFNGEPHQASVEYPTHPVGTYPWMPGEYTHWRFGANPPLPVLEGRDGPRQVQPWQPGTWGKGSVHYEGDPIHWQTEDMGDQGPTHMTVLERMGLAHHKTEPRWANDPEQQEWSHFVINPQGHVQPVMTGLNANGGNANNPDASAGKLLAQSIGGKYIDEDGYLFARTASLPMVHEHDYEPDFGYGDWGRRPVVYDARTNDIHIGPDQETHNGLEEHLGLPINDREGSNERYHGWMGANSEAELHQVVDEDRQDTPMEFGWYTPPPGPYDEASEALQQHFNATKEPEGWHFGKTATTIQMPEGFHPWQPGWHGKALYNPETDEVAHWRTSTSAYDGAPIHDQAREALGEAWGYHGPHSLVIAPDGQVSDLHAGFKSEDSETAVNAVANAIGGTPTEHGDYWHFGAAEPELPEGTYPWQPGVHSRILISPTRHVTWWHDHDHPVMSHLDWPYDSTHMDYEPRKENEWDFRSGVRATEVAATGRLGASTQLSRSIRMGESGLRAANGQQSESEDAGWDLSSLESGRAIPGGNTNTGGQTSVGRGVDSRRRAARSEMGGEDKEQQNVTLRDMHRVMLVSAEGDKGLHSVEASDTTCSIVQQGQDPDNPDMKAANTAKEVDTPLHDTNPHQSSLSSPLPHPSPSLAQSAALRRAALTPADELRSFLRPHTSTLTPSAEVSDLGLGHEGNAPHTACKWGEVVEPRPIVMPSPSDVPHVGTAGVLDAQQQPAVNSRPSFREFPIVQSIREAFGVSDSRSRRLYHNSAIGDPLPARDRLQVPVLASAPEWNDVPVLYANGKWIIGASGEYHDDIHPLITRPGDAFYGEAGQQRARTESDGKSIYLEWYGGPKHPEVAADLAQRSGLPVQEDTLNSEGHWNFASIGVPGNPFDSNPQVPLHFPQGFDLNDSQRVPFIYTVNGQGQQPQVYFGHPGTEHAAITEPGGKTWSYSDQDYYDMPEMHPGLYNRVSPNKGPDGNWQWNESIGGYGSVKPRSWYTGDKSDTSKLTEFYTTHEPQHIKAVADAIHAHQPFGLPPTHDHQSYERSEPDPNEDWNFEGKTANYEEPLPEPLVNWKPGTLGKGLVTPEGRAYTWQIDRNHGIDGYPSHDQAYEAIHGHPMDDRAWDRGSYYTIHSDGHAAPLLENNSVHHAIMKAHLPEGDHCFHCGAEVHPDEDGTYTCSCGVHSQVEPEPDPDEWHFANGSIMQLKGSKRHYTAQLMWNPPNTGKGFVAGDKLYTWNTSGNRPHHAEMWDHFRKSEPELPTMNAAFAIGSSGAVTKEYGNPDEYEPHLWQDPRLRVDPETEGSEWRFASLSDAPQGAVGDKKFTVTTDVGGFVQNGGHVLNTKYRQGVTKPWELGKIGKGMLLDGKLHLWDDTVDAQTDPPHHDDVHESIYPEPHLDPDADQTPWRQWIDRFFDAPKFYVGSNGKLDSYRTKNLQFDHETLDQIAAMHPDLTAPRPTDQGWDFS